MAENVAKSCSDQAHTVTPPTSFRRSIYPLYPVQVCTICRSASISIQQVAWSEMVGNRAVPQALDRGREPHSAKTRILGNRELLYCAAVNI